MNSGATFSPCRRYRYALWREWDESKASVIFCGLNPSTADETQDDPTIRREIDFARRWGFGRLVKVNAYAWRSTDPKGLWETDDPRGPDNFLAIKAHCFDCMRKRQGGLFVAAWGNNIRDQDDQDLLRALRFEGIKVYVLKLTKRCLPGHPLYLPKTAWPFERATGEPWAAPWPLPEVA